MWAALASVASTALKSGGSSPAVPSMINPSVNITAPAYHPKPDNTALLLGAALVISVLILKRRRKR